MSHILDISSWRRAAEDLHVKIESFAMISFNQECYKVFSDTSFQVRGIGTFTFWIVIPHLHACYVS